MTRPLFTQRYGLRPIEGLAPEDHWHARHTLHGDPAIPDDPASCGIDMKFRCVCPGSVQPLTDIRCCRRATQEDGQCDHCREGCLASDGHRTRHLVTWRRILSSNLSA